MKNQIEKICISGIMLALSSVLSLIKIPFGPLGGSITLLSMIPVSLLGIWYGFGFALLPCVIYGVIQLFLDGFLSWGLTPLILVGSLFFDYIFAFGILSVSGVFRNKKGGRIWGVALGCFGRFICHFISGLIFFRTFDVFSSPVLYSLVYNGGYMLPELILTTAGVYALQKFGVIDRAVKRK